MNTPASFFPLLSPREYSHKFAFQLKGQERKNVAKTTFTRFIYIHLDHDLQDLSLRNKEEPHSDKKRKKH